MIRLIKIKKKYDKNILYKEFSANLNYGDIVGIFGENGSGKTTLLDIIGKKIIPSEGKVIYEPENLTIGYFEQISDEDILQYEKMTISSGEIVKQNLKKIIDHNYDVYLFDEPTNHLDENSKENIAKEIKKLPGIKVIASHDRKFLSICCSKIWDIDDNKITVYNSGFDKFIDKKSESRFEIEDTYSKILRKVTALRLSDNKRQDKFSMMRKSKKADPVKFYRKKTKFLHQNKVYKNRIRRLLKNELPKLPKDKQQLIIDFINSPIEDLFLVRINNISKKYGKKLVFKDIDFEILPNEKILISGANGAGKTSLLKIIAQLETDFTGNIEYSPNINFRYFKQENFQDLNYKYSVREELSKFIFSEQLIANKEDISDERLESLYKISNIHDDQILEHIEKLGFDNKYLDMLVNDLSEGEKIKLRFAKILLLEPNLLILDEPTNHLDLNNKIGIINAIKRFKGACIVVTHDTELINDIPWDFHLKM